MSRKQRVSRRELLAATAVGALAGSSGAAGAKAARPVMKWDGETDVVVVGSGAAACTAAACSAGRGSRVIMLEKADAVGGTTVKSGGACWVPNNSHMRRDRIADPKPDALRYMARLAFPTRYNSELPHLGLAQNDFELIEAFYDSASEATDELARIGALQLTYFVGKKGDKVPDYYAHLPENKAPFGRTLGPAGADGKAIYSGVEMIRQLIGYGRRNGVTVLTGHAVQRLIRGDDGHVIGVEATHAGRSLSFRARKAVIFGTGGFTQNPEMALNFLRGPIFGGCAVPSNTGDFVLMAAEAGAPLGNMNNAWWAEVVLEQALANRSVANDVFYIPGDSCILVNRYGRRVVNETILYNERAQAHFYWDPVAAEYSNLLLFMIYDQRTAASTDAHWFGYPLPPPGGTAPYVIVGRDLADLEANINTRLKKLASKLPAGLVLETNFTRQLQETLRRFNRFAEEGVDEDFRRGATNAMERYFIAESNGKPNPAMYPMADEGPYYCIILAPGTLDSKGGPRVNANAQVLERSGAAIPGLYGAGNCIASPAGQAYWGGGGTLGPALTFGYLAARHAATLPVRSA